MSMVVPELSTQINFLFTVGIHVRIAVFKNSIFRKCFCIFRIAGVKYRLKTLQILLQKRYKKYSCFSFLKDSFGISC